jgi:hypothetical protein
MQADTSFKHHTTATNVVLDRLAKHAHTAAHPDHAGEHEKRALAILKIHDPKHPLLHTPPLQAIHAAVVPSNNTKSTQPRHDAVGHQPHVTPSAASLKTLRPTPSQPLEQAFPDTETESEVEFAYKRDHPAPVKAHLPEFYKGQWWADKARNMSENDFVVAEVLAAMGLSVLATFCCLCVCK